MITTPVRKLISTKAKPITKTSKAICLTSHQQAAADKLNAFLNSSERLFLLTGYSGVGKTSVLTTVMAEQVEANSMLRVAFTALSNKAVKVIRNMAKAAGIGSNSDSMTVCKLLGLQLKVNQRTGAQEFKPDPKNPPSLDKYDVVIVDEISMIGAELWRLLIDALESQGFLHSTQIICVGDSAQLPPVNERLSPAFEHVPPHSQAHLSEVVRYDGAVGELAEQVRLDPFWAKSPVINSSANADNTKGVWLLSDADFHDVIRGAFGSKKYGSDKDAAKILCYTNKCVEEMNDFVHEFRYGKDAPKYVEGMGLMANSPVTKGRDMIMANSDECVVETARTGQDGPWKVWVLDVLIEDYKSSTIYALHESEQAKYDKLLKDYADAKQWKAYWDLRQRFADVRGNAAITVHKSQGSTYQDVFVVTPDIMRCRDVETCTQLFYVALSRAANRAFFASGR